MKFESGSSVRRKIHLFQLPWDNQNLQRSQTFVYINVVLLVNFPEQFELPSTSNIQEVIKLYNLGDKKFETDFSFET